MEVIYVFGIIAGIVFLGYFSELIFKKFNIPDVIFLILIGIIIKSVLNWIDSEAFGNGATLFATFALVFILFQGALNIDFKTLFQSLSKTVYLTLVSFIFTAIIVTAIAFTLGNDLYVSLLIGMILGGTSSAVVIPLVSNLNMNPDFGLILKLESAISDILCIIGAITIIEVIETGKIVASGIFRSILSSFSLAIIVGSITGLLWIALLHKFNFGSKSYVLTIAAIIGLYAFVESPFVKASGAIAALTFGLFLGNSRTIISLTTKKSDNEEKDHSIHKKLLGEVLSVEAKNFYSEISFFVKTFFFVYLGILIDFNNPLVFLYGSILTLGIFLVRPLAVRLVFKHEDLKSKERTYLETLIPKGLAAAILAQIAVQRDVVGTDPGHFINTILSIVLISILFTSLLAFMTNKGWFKGFFLTKKLRMHDYKEEETKE